MFPVPLNPRIAQLGKILQGIFHIPLSPIYIHHAYSNLYASALGDNRLGLLFSSALALSFRNPAKESAAAFQRLPLKL